MKVTHQCNFGTRGDVAAWQYQPNIAWPDWVTHNVPKEIKINVGDWIIAFPEEKGILIINDDEFLENFRPL